MPTVAGCYTQLQACNGLQQADSNVMGGHGMLASGQDGMQEVQYPHQCMTISGLDVVREACSTIRE
jgi:hypothetical protein